MTPETSRLIAETLRLDAESIAAAKDWKDHPCRQSMEVHMGALDRARDHHAEFAPRLARMLEVAVSALDREQSSRCDRVLAEIEKIAKGES